MNIYAAITSISLLANIVILIVTGRDRRILQARILACEERWHKADTIAVRLSISAIRKSLEVDGFQIKDAHRRSE
jgi:hypothetical protein